MTLEHISETRAFLGSVQRALVNRKRVVVHFQVPDASRILSEAVFWDVYYEHCSYFTASALTQLFRISGFDVLEVSRSFGGQYLAVTATVGGHADQPMESATTPKEVSDGEIDAFARRCRNKVMYWQEQIDTAGRNGGAVALWGGGSKAVSFLSHMPHPEKIACAVDINPHRQGTYLVGSGHEIVAPERLQAIAPELVIVMNGMYLKEISASLEKLGLSPAVQSVDGGDPG